MAVPICRFPCSPQIANFGGDTYPSVNRFQGMIRIFSTFHQSCLVHTWQSLSRMFDFGSILIHQLPNMSKSVNREAPAALSRVCPMAVAHSIFQYSWTFHSSQHLLFSPHFGSMAVGPDRMREERPVSAKDLVQSLGQPDLKSLHHHIPGSRIAI